MNTELDSKIPKSFRYINQMIRKEYIDMILAALNPETQIKVAWYFESTPDKNWGYFSQRDDTSNEILWSKWEKIVVETLVFDIPEKTRIRMLNFLALDFVEYHYYIHQPDLIIEPMFLYVPQDFKF